MSSSLFVFETLRLRARHLEAGDVDRMLAVYGDPEVVRWVGDGTPLDRAGCERWVEVTERNYATRGYGMLALAERQSGAVVGFCGLVHPGGQEEAEIKYALHRDWWGKGLATEAAVALLAYGASRFGLRYVIATTAPENAASHHVLRKAGMERGELRREDDGSWTQLFVWRAPSSEASPLPKERL
jgi:ribosomal-protein-alanine N-acetyltransferase